MDRPTLLRRIRESLEEAFGERLKGIVLYGSEARGEATPESDIDLLVIVNQSDLTPHQIDAIAYRSLGDIPVPIDVQVYTQAEFDQRSALTVSFERTVRTKGRLVHAA
jgi:predicted nucleotidyltransferase